MNEQDKRAVECLCRCGLDFDGVCKSFSSFPVEELKLIYNLVHQTPLGELVTDVSRNCS